MSYVHIKCAYDAWYKMIPTTYLIHWYMIFMTKKNECGVKKKFLIHKK